MPFLLIADTIFEKTGLSRRELESDKDLEQKSAKIIKLMTVTFTHLDTLRA